MELVYKTIENDEEYLRQISKPVDFCDNSWKEALFKLAYFCKNDDNLMALAAIQIGIPLRMVYLKKTNFDRLDENYNEARVLINPVITKREGLTRYWEACASCLDNTGLVERPYKITLEYYDVNGQKYHEIFEGSEATVLSHEMDHLDGILHIDIALEILQMTKEERKEFRRNHPYEIIRKDGKFLDNEINFLKK